LGTPRWASADIIDFEDLKLKPDSYYNGSDQTGGFVSRGAAFNNHYNAMFDTWSGWSYSNKTDVKTPGFQNQYSAYNLPDGGGDNSPNYGLAFNFNFGDALIQLPKGTAPQSVRITNTTYAALSMRDGDQFSRRFGGDSGLDPDWFLLTIYGLDDGGEMTGSVDFYLADYRFQDPELNYIVDSWTTVDLTDLGNAMALGFDLTSSDNGPFGMNTPAYFAVDNLVVK
jgi:hypothetical protein